MENKAKLIIFTNGEKLISQIEELPSELGEPDCKLIKPFLILNDQTITSWLIDYTSQDTFMIHSDKILTISDPKENLLKKYENMIK
jgi:hypothetical protein